MGIKKKIVKRKAIELVMDWNLWPRHSAQKLDSSNLRNLRNALRVGKKLPPIIISTDDRVIDGFHRVKSHLDIFGDDAVIEAIVKEYKNDAEMFLDAGKYNLHHGLRMSSQDRAHFIAKCRKMKIPPARIADILSEDPEETKRFLKERTATTQDGETIALPYGVAKAFSGKVLTREQESTVRKSNGTLPIMYMSMLVNHLKSDAVVITEKTIDKMLELYELLGMYIGELRNE